MFYCDKCKDEYSWPISLFKSHGKCELCKEVTSCNNVPSSKLPNPNIKFTKDGQPYEVKSYERV